MTVFTEDEVNFFHASILSASTMSTMGTSDFIVPFDEDTAEEVINISGPKIIAADYTMTFTAGQETLIENTLNEDIDVGLPSQKAAILAKLGG